MPKTLCIMGWRYLSCFVGVQYVGTRSGPPEPWPPGSPCMAWHFCQNPLQGLYLGSSFPAHNWGHISEGLNINRHLTPPNITLRILLQVIPSNIALMSRLDNAFPASSRGISRLQRPDGGFRAVTAITQSPETGGLVSSCFSPRQLCLHAPPGKPGPSFYSQSASARAVHSQPAAFSIRQSLFSSLFPASALRLTRRWSLPPLCEPSRIPPGFMSPAGPAVYFPMRARGRDLALLETNFAGSAFSAPATMTDRNQKRKPWWQHGFCISVGPRRTPSSGFTVPFSPEVRADNSMVAAPGTPAE